MIVQSETVILVVISLLAVALIFATSSVSAKTKYSPINCTGIEAENLAMARELDVSIARAWALATSGSVSEFSSHTEAAAATTEMKTIARRLTKAHIDVEHKEDDGQSGIV